MSMNYGAGIRVVSEAPLPADVAALRKPTREHIDEAVVTAGDLADREVARERLNDSLATKLVCALRYRCHHLMAGDIIRHLAEQDPTTRRMMEGIRALVEENADEWAELLAVRPEESYEAKHYAKWT